MLEEPDEGQGPAHNEEVLHGRHGQRRDRGFGHDPVGQFVGEIETQIADALVDLEATGEDALKALWLQDTTDILDTTLTYEIHPSAVDHNEHGLRLVMAGRTLTDPHPCVAEWSGDGSLLTEGPLPAMTPSIPSNNAVYHLGAMLADDFANQALWNLWNGGVMCFVVRDGDGSLHAKPLPEALRIVDERWDGLYEFA